MKNKKLTLKEWLSENGFSEDGTTFLVLGDSYSIKQQLKEQGFKYSALLKWHTDNNTFSLPDNCSWQPVHFDDFFIWDEEQGIAFLQDGARSKIENIFSQYEVQINKSDYVGEVGERLYNIPATLFRAFGSNGFYGYIWTYIFEDIDGNRYSWQTTSQQAISVGQHLTFNGTVKAHKEYKGTKVTILTRCAIFPTIPSYVTPQTHH